MQDSGASTYTFTCPSCVMRFTLECHVRGSEIRHKGCSRKELAERMKAQRTPCSMEIMIIHQEKEDDDDRHAPSSSPTRNN